MAQTVQLEKLPEAARHELLDFYEFLMQKYVKSDGGSAKKADGKAALKKTDKNPSLALQSLSGIWKDRSVSLESLRRSAWQRQP